MKKCSALIVAAGRGERFGSNVPKQYQMLNQKMIIQYSMETFSKHRLINSVKVVINENDIELYNIAAKNFKLLPFAIGGKTRQESVFLGLQSLKQENPDIVLIHDAARPFIDADTISNIINATSDDQAAIAAIPVTDTIKQSINPISKNILRTIDRSTLWQAQTPQAFPFNQILKLHYKYQNTTTVFTDDAAIFEAENIPVQLIPSNSKNIKITSMQDLEMINDKIQKNEIRIGQGFDVHSFTTGNSITICGLKIPYSKSLLGHSDADVAWHALTDALYGSISAGDIGLHFPPSEQKWKNAPSKIFLKHALNLISSSGAKINNVDITIVCEEPKISIYRNEMIKKTAEILQILPEQISIKGTTTEKLGFTGRKEGIAALASVIIQKNLGT